MATFTTGPVDRDFVEGTLTNWHFEVFNNTATPKTVTAMVIGLDPTTVLQSTTVIVPPLDLRSITIFTQNREHTIAVLTTPAGTTQKQILINIYGRTFLFRQLSGAVYRETELVDPEADSMLLNLLNPLPDTAEKSES